ncbi:MAG: hypothetical protein KF761_12225 [Salinibacterium sp.]|nr:hypothetical protein [Salinibacterium sp.]
MTRPSDTDSVKLRPHVSVLRQGLLGVVAFSTPVFIVLYFLTVPHGPWKAVLATQVLASIVVVVALILYLRVGIWVNRTSITEIGILGRIKRVEADEIGSVFVATVFEASGTTSLPQLFVRDKQGKQVVRMRGQYWSKASMDIVVATLDVPKHTRQDSVSTRELRDSYPGLLYWFERRPVIAALAFVALVGLVGLVIWALFDISGMT